MGLVIRPAAGSPLAVGVPKKRKPNPFRPYPLFPPTRPRFTSTPNLKRPKTPKRRPTDEMLDARLKTRSTLLPRELEVPTGEEIGFRGFQPSERLVVGLRGCSRSRATTREANNSFFTFSDSTRRSPRSRALIGPIVKGRTNGPRIPSVLPLFYYHLLHTQWNYPPPL